MRIPLAVSRFWLATLLTLVGVLGLGGLVHGQEGEVAFDFRQPGTEVGWSATHDVQLSPSKEGLRVSITGADPYITGPVLKTPPAGRTLVCLRMPSETGGGGQLFYDADGPREEHSVKFSVPARVDSENFGSQPAVMTEVFLALPEVGPEIRFRLDPPGTSGECVIESIRVVSGIQQTYWNTDPETLRPH